MPRPTNIVFMSHAKRHVKMETPVIIVENVQDMFWFAAGIGLLSVASCHMGCFRAFQLEYFPGFTFLWARVFAGFCGVEEVSLATLEKLYGMHYNLFPVYVEPGHLGQTGVERRRVYIIMSHKRTVQQIYNPQKIYDKICKCCRLFVQTRPRDYWCSTARDVHLEAERVALTRRIPLRPGVTGC